MANTIPSVPSEAETTLAKETSRVLAKREKTLAPLRLKLLDGPVKGTINLPGPAVHMLVRILDEMAQGNAVTLTPVHTELTTQEAADMLNISRPSLIELLRQGKISFRKVGTHRRILLADVISYKRSIDAARKATLEELAAYDQELGL